MNVTLDLLIQLGIGVITLAGFAWGIISWVVSQFAVRDAAISRLREEVAAHKLYAAETFATSHELATALGRVEQSIERLTDRLDRLLEGKKLNVA